MVVSEYPEVESSLELRKGAIILTDAPNENYSLKHFEKDVYEVANQAPYSFVRNDDDNHSQITAANIFRTSKKEILIYTTGFQKNLNDDPFGFKKELISCLERIPKVQIILDKGNTNTDVIKEVKRIASQKRDNIEIKVIKNKHEAQKVIHELLGIFMPGLLNNLHLNGKTPLHFIIGDGKKYRLEYDSMNKCAIVNFNDSFNANALKIAFNELFHSYSNPHKI